MKTNIYRNLLLLLITSCFCFPLQASDPDAPAISAGQFETVPTIDGVMEDLWEPLEWNSLNHVWMEWGTIVDSADYYGRFKVGYSEETDLLYFLVEITDDVIVETFGELGGRHYYNDIVEIFIDENNSGGEHIFDAGSTNAENAFSYHVTPLEEPTEEAPETDFTVNDVAGTSWGSTIPIDYITHFDDVVLTKQGDVYYWEMALKVYKDDYNAASDEGTLAELEPGKVMGLALAYCESDKAEGNGREAFFGSFPGHSDKLTTADDGNLYGYNETWMDATDYNVLTLEGEITSVDKIPSAESSPIKIRTSSEGHIIMTLEEDYMGAYSIEIFDIMGRRVHEFSSEKHDLLLEHRFSLPGESRGCYILQYKTPAVTRSAKFIF